MTEFVIIVESEADFRTASEIANRIFTEQIDWIEPYLSGLLHWRGLQANTHFSCWKDVRRIQEEMENRGIHLSRVRNIPGSDGASASKILQMVDKLQRDKNRNIQAVVLIRDIDHQPERRSSLEQARQKYSAIVTVIGTADGKREAWILNGFVSANEIEESLLIELQKQLGFDPVLQAHRLRATTFDEPVRIRNAKVVLDRLTKSDSERESQCWQNTALELLRDRGVHTGLTSYMNEVEERLVPILQQE